MDAELVALASTAASALVGRLAGDGWEQVKKAIGGLWRRSRPERPEEAESIEASLADTRQELLAAHESGRGEAAEQEFAIEWRTRLRDLLAADPSLAEELRRLLAELQAGEAESGAGNTVTMNATASGHAKVFMSGRDMHITGK